MPGEGLRPFQRRFLAGALAPGIDTAALRIPRGNGKSWLAAHVLARCLTPGDSLYVDGAGYLLCAASLEQARIVFRFIRAALEPLGKYRFLDAPTRLGIAHKASNTRLRVLSSNGKTAFGIVSCPILVADEPGSCVAVTSHVKANAETVAKLLCGQVPVDRDELAELLVEALSGLSEMEPDADLASDKQLLMSKWLDGDPVATISMASDKPEEVTRYIEEVFSYLLPWGISAYLRIAASELKLDQLPLLASNIAGMVKYGVPTAEAVWASTAGLASRSAATRVVSSTYAYAKARALPRPAFGAG